MHRVVVLHGPPGCGKDTLTKGFVRGGFQHIGISDGIRSWIANHCPPHKDTIGATKTDAKDLSQRALNGRSPRDLQIHIGNLENFFPTIWTDEAVEAIDDSRPTIIDSVKHNSQLMNLQLALLRRFDDIRIYVIEVVRPGYDWGRMNDSRVPLRPVGDHFVLHNDFGPIVLEEAGQILANHMAQETITNVHQTEDSLRRSYSSNGEPYPGLSRQIDMSASRSLFLSAPFISHQE